LGFEERPSNRTSTSTANSPIHISPFPIHARSQSHPLQTKPTIPTRLNASTQDTPLVKRPRAPSDPFLDAPAPSRSYSSSPHSFVVPLSTSLSDTIEEPPSPVTPTQETEDIFNPRPTAKYAHQEIDEEFMRTWISPDLANPEFLQLLKVFPTFITRRATPRFPNNASDLHPRSDLETGRRLSVALGEIQVGTGKMWVSEQPRTEGWEGNWWTRLKNWWHQLFC
jgi:hypothetical protein